MMLSGITQRYTNDDALGLLAKPGVLAVISFEPSCEKPETLGCIPIGLTSLSGKTEEVIRVGSTHAERGSDNDCQWSVIEDTICIATWISEAGCEDIEAATHNAYCRIWATLLGMGFANVFRMWNFMPNINSGQGDCEEYKKFCVGRQQAFDQLGLTREHYPAASALGHHSRGAVIYALASRATQAVHHENPRQQSAYCYPRQYGPVSPSFARATTLPSAEYEQIFVSGTASIIGHETYSPTDLKDQLRITVENIDLLLAHISETHEAPTAIRVYLRRKEDYAQAATFLQQRFPEQHINIVWADICRANLLVEIELVSRSVLINSQGECET